ncbi:MAG: DUF2069 domain-containing protein [Aquificaceae bacterium]|nr:MAG: DUF2069 domain-containing protein [Aquificaceae bacterium]
MLNNLLLWRFVTFIGLFGMIALIVIWNGWLTPSQYINRGIEIAIFTMPLLFFVRGILYADREKHIAITLLSFVYFCLGIWFIFAPDESIYGYIMTVLSLCLYFGGFFYVRALDKSKS